MRNAIIDLVCVVGVGCIVAAGFLVYIPLGLLLLGAPLVAVSLQLKKAKPR